MTTNPPPAAEDRACAGALRICAFQRSLVAGGVARQWNALLARHVRRGGSATIVADGGPLADRAVESGIAFCEAGWESDAPPPDAELARLAAAHDVAVVVWDPLVIRAFAPALGACGAAALALHSQPSRLVDWFGPPAHRAALAVARDAIACRRATVIVTGERHRLAAAHELGVSADALAVLPASVAVARSAFAPVTAPPGEVLALVRLSPEKSPVVRLAAQLVRAGRDAGHACRLTVAGDGPWRSEALAICDRLLSADQWRWEPPPADPEARLARAQLAVTQGLTTLEAAALGRRAVIARDVEGSDDAAGAVLTTATYDSAARDPFASPEVTRDHARLWHDALAVGAAELAALRGLVERHNSVSAAGRTMDGVLRALVRA